MWYRGREEQNKQYLDPVSTDKPVIWFHVSSLGEFEQALPLIKGWRSEKPDYFILLTFYSPSGYLNKKDCTDVDRVLYLPRERNSEIDNFLDCYHPQIAVFIKYDVWPILLDELDYRKIPTFLISAVFRKDQLYFRWYGKWYLSALKYFSGILVQDATSLQLLKSNGVNHVKIFGDTRIDRVVELAEKNRGIEGIDDFKGDNRLIIGGSTWPAEEAFLKRFFRENQTRGIKLIIAPHDVNEDHLKKIEDDFGSSLLRYDQLIDNPALGKEKSVLLIDRVGILSKVYYHCDLAFIGGAFGAGLHNILEPAAYGIPVIFGPRYHKFIEAHELINSGAAFSINSYAEFNDKMDDLLNDQNALSSAGKGCRMYVDKRKGASSLVISHLLEKV